MFAAGIDAGSFAVKVQLAVNGNFSADTFTVTWKSSIPQRWTNELLSLYSDSSNQHCSTS